MRPSWSAAMKRMFSTRERPGAVVRTVPMTRDIRGAGEVRAAGAIFCSWAPSRICRMWMPSSGLPARSSSGPGAARRCQPAYRGQGSPPDVAALGASAGMSGRHPIVIHGYRPHIDELLDGCRLSVAPLRWGAGIKGKVATSLAAGLPCVATSVAVEGAGLVAGQEILVADAPSEIAAAVRPDLSGRRPVAAQLGRQGSRPPAGSFPSLPIGTGWPSCFWISASRPPSLPLTARKGLRYAGIERISRLCRKHWSNLRRRASGCGFQFLVLAMLALFPAAALPSSGIMSSA